jgi:hypothetical protein
VIAEEDEAMARRAFRTVLLTMAGAVVGAATAAAAYCWIIVPYALPRDDDPIGYMGVFIYALRICIAVGGMAGMLLGLRLAARWRRD